MEDLITEIDTTPDLKASVDLNTRMVAENAMLTIELIRLQSLALQLGGNVANDEMVRMRQNQIMNTYESSTIEDVYGEE